MQKHAYPCQTQAETEQSMHAYVCEGERAHSRSALPPTAPIKACVISEVAAMKSQPRAHLFKRGNNEFFVASHLPITINLAFCRYVHSDPYCIGFWSGAFHVQMLCGRQIYSLPPRQC